MLGSTPPLVFDGDAGAIWIPACSGWAGNFGGNGAILVSGGVPIRGVSLDGIRPG